MPSLRRIPVGSLNSFYYQSPHPTPDLDPGQAIVDAISTAKESLYFATYSFTLKAIADAVLAAHARGITVYGLIDATALRSPTTQIPALIAAGIDIRQWGGQWQLMHDKVFVVDGTTKNAKVGLGSYNWTSQAQKENTEVLLICTGKQVSKGLGPALQAQITAARSKGKPVDLAP